MDISSACERQRYLRAVIRFRVLGLGARVSGLVVRVLGLGFRGSGFMLQTFSELDTRRISALVLRRKKRVPDVCERDRILLIGTSVPYVSGVQDSFPFRPWLHFRDDAILRPNFLFVSDYV